MPQIRLDNIPIEGRLLLTCIRQPFTKADRDELRQVCRERNIAWQDVYEAAQRQNVAPIVYERLRHCHLDNEIPEAVWQRFKHDYRRNVALKSGVAHQIGQILAFFHRLGLPVMLIKGAAMDLCVHDHPWYTVHDVDLVIGAKQEALPAETVAEIVAFFRHRPGFEYDFYAHHDVVMNGILPVDFSWIWQDVQVVPVQDCQVHVMAAEDMLLAACINSGRKRYFRLKSLLDIAAILARYPDLQWQRLAAKADHYECRAILFAALHAVEMTVGLSLSPEQRRTVDIHPLPAALIRWMSRQIAPGAFAARRTGLDLFGRRLAWPLLLTYVTLRPYQISRRLRYVWRTRDQQ